MTSPESERKINIPLIALVLVMVAMAAFVLFKQRSAPPVNVNYDDPNMLKTNEFVNEATASCLQKDVDASGDLRACINNYKGEVKETSPQSSAIPTSTEPAPNSSSDPAAQTPN